jgi:hypothetical protein
LKTLGRVETDIFSEGQQLLIGEQQGKEYSRLYEGLFIH